MAKHVLHSTRLSVLVMLTACMWAAPTASAGPTMLVEESSGRVIYAEEPDQSWFPASLTKLLTAYVVFDAVKTGKLKLDTPVPLSDKARGQPATRIGLKAGIPLKVEEALRGLIGRSANDFAMALAELIGGSEEGFAEIMNATAKRIGMTRSHFRNPHGLPDPEQHTTARDMTILARAVLRDFPERAEMFSTQQFVIYKGTFYSQNEILRAFEGADGMKTGFTCGAGYNIVASATRDGRRIIAVVLGEAQRDSRRDRTVALLDHGFAVADWKALVGAPTIAQLEPDPRQPNAVHDMSRETRTRTCGNPVRRVRAIASKARPVPAADGGAQVAVRPAAAAPPASAPVRAPAAGFAGGGPLR